MMKRTAVLALLAMASVMSAFSQKALSPAWKKGEVILLLNHQEDAARMVNRSRQVTPSATRRLKRLVPVADREKSIGRVMADIGARELVPLDQPEVGAPVRAAASGSNGHPTAANAPQADWLTVPKPFTPAEQDLLSRLFLLRYDADDIDAPEAAALLSSADEVEVAEPNLLLHISADDSTFVIPPDSITTVTATRLDEQWWLRSIGLTELWKQRLIKNLRIKIAIIDTGVDTTHPDLQGNVSSEGYDFPRDTTEVVDFHGHGTHCAGIAAANGKGVVAGACPEALILPITVMDKQGMGNLFDIMLGVIYAVRHGSHFISMSLGGYGSSTLYESIVSVATSHSIVFAAAGNDGLCLQSAHRDLHGMATPHIPCVPAAYPGVVGVMSTDEDGSLSYFSNFDCNGSMRADSVTGFNYEIRAPGRNILSTLPDGQYGYMSGTSMACPLAAGAVARLCLSSRWSTVEQLVQTLIMTQDPQLNLMAALTASQDQLWSDAFQLQNDSLTLSFVRLDSFTVQLGDGVHAAVISRNGNLPVLTIPDEVRGLAVTTLAPHALDGCTQTHTLLLGRSVSDISPNAINGCTALADIYVVSDTPPSCASSAFSSQQMRSVRLNVPNGFTAPYAEAPVWRDFSLCRESELATGNRFLDECTLYPLQAQENPTAIPATYLIYNMESGIGMVGAGEPAIDKATAGRIVIPDEVRVPIKASDRNPSLLMAVIGDYAFQDCEELTGIQLPRQLQQIWFSVFQNCKALQEVELPERVSYIGSRAFVGCSSLHTLYLSKSLRTISNYAFAECPNLRLVVVPMEAPPPLPENAFITKIPTSSSAYDLEQVGGVYETARLVVPAGCRYLYAEAPGWQLFRHIDEMTPEGEIPNAVTTPHAEGLPAASNQHVYSLTGQRFVSGRQLPAGLYIIDRRKVFIR